MTKKIFLSVTIYMGICIVIGLGMSSILRGVV